MSKIKEAVDVIRLGVQVAGEVRNRDRAQGVFEKNAGRLAVHVEKGVVDPTVAEVLLDEMEAVNNAHQRGPFEAPEKSGPVLERLVTSEAIDPVFAENMLNNFGINSFKDASEAAAKHSDS